MNNLTRGELDDLKNLKDSTEMRRMDNLGGRNRKLFFDNRIEREWLSTDEAAYYLSISANALRILVHRDQIKVHKFGRRLRFKLVDCRALIEMKGA
ncbi:MAG: helix-turn-helix domain-containing protein [Oligoflexia bacterium]|nr:helix-turn-helix domain-containing protein [Oligoflexia bacterium]